MADKLTLLPCPWCGNTPKAHEYMDEDVGRLECFLHCEACDISLDTYPTQAEAIAAWNRRVPSPALTAAREALRDLSRAVDLGRITAMGNSDNHQVAHYEEIGAALRDLAALLKEQTHG